MKQPLSRWYVVVASSGSRYRYSSSLPGATALVDVARQHLEREHLEREHLERDERSDAPSPKGGPRLPGCQVIGRLTARPRRLQVYDRGRAFTVIPAPDPGGPPDGTPQGSPYGTPGGRVAA
ncbi:MAG: hypothetical protein R3247_01365 [Rhodothermales bacterium]|nr:hypothetical protein [Rhodothermales bacterium]